MRTTVTLDDDTAELVRRRMEQRKVSFKQALNDAIRDGVGGSRRVDFHTDVVSMGHPSTNLDRALQIAAQLDDNALILRMQSGS